MRQTEDVLKFLDDPQEFEKWFFRKRAERKFPKGAIERAAIHSRRAYFDDDDDDGQEDGLTCF